MKRHFACLFFMLGVLLSLQAADVTFTASAPSSVVVGQQFRLTYSFNTTDIKDFRIPEIEGFDILMGPSTSTSISIVNGKTDKSMTYTYVLLPQKEGTFNIAGATASVKKTQYTSNSVTIKVLPADKQSSSSQGSASSGTQSRQAQGASSAQSLSAENLFIRAIPSRTKVMEQEGILLTFKLYTRVDVSGFENAQFPEYKGFLSQEIDLGQNAPVDMENYNGLNYRTYVLKQTVLYPQQSGELQIESGSFDVVVRVRNTSTGGRSFFDDFFETYSDVRKTIKTNPIKITVEPFPFGKPANFNAFAGSLKLTSTASPTELKTDEAVTVKVVLTGNGNMKMLKTPDIKFPADFDAYDPKVSNNFKVTAQGVTGSKTIEYLAIPRFAGTYEIPSVELSYYDVATKSYKTLATDPFTINVEKGAGSSESSGTVVAGNYTGKQNVRHLGEDIHYIKTGELKLKQEAELVYGQSWFFLLYVVPFVLFVVLLVIYRKQIRDNANVAKQRTKKASKVAVKRLKKAATYLKAQDRAHFYDEVTRALWGYTADKLNIPLSKLTKETIDKQLTDCQVNDETRRAYMDILETCEFEQYAPASSTEAMDELYEKTIKVIDKMENTIRTKSYAK